jgi:hypothetical protein
MGRLNFFMAGPVGTLLQDTVSVYRVLLRKILLAALNIAVILVGTASTLLLSAYLDYIFRQLWFPPMISLVFGSAATVMTILSIRRKTRQGDIEYEAARWLAKQATRQPNSHKKLRAAVRQCLLWLPSSLAAFVLFFYPLASHIVHPGDHYLTHYRVSIPWTWELLSRQNNSNGYSYVETTISSEGSSRFGVTPYWHKYPALSAVRFWTFTSGLSPEDEQSYEELRHEGATSISSVELKAGNVPLTCWQYVRPGWRGWWLNSLNGADLWEVDCATPLNVREANFRGFFAGRKEDIPAFYEVLAKVTSVD